MMNSGIRNPTAGASLVGLVGALAACAPSAPTPMPTPQRSEPQAAEVQRESVPAIAAQPGPCAAAVELATARFQADQPNAIPPTFTALAPDPAEPYDFDADGHADCVVVPGGWDERWIYVADGAAKYRFVGNIIADDLNGFACLTTVTNGLCNIAGSQQMIHGETQTREYAYDGGVYRQVTVRLSAPHPKFGP